MDRTPRTSMVVAVAVTAVVSVLATLGVAGALDNAPGADEPRPVPGSGEDVDEYALALLPEPADDAWSHTVTLAGVSDVPREMFVVPPGEFQMHLACETVARSNTRLAEITLIIRAADDIAQYLMPCPSTPLALPDTIVYTEHTAMSIEVWDAGGGPQSFAVAAMITGVRAPEAMD